MKNAVDEKEEIVKAYEGLSGPDKKTATILAKEALVDMGVDPPPSLSALHSWRKRGGRGRNGLNRFYKPAYQTALARLRSSKLAEAENIEAHDEYLRERHPEVMEEGYSNS